MRRSGTFLGVSFISFIFFIIAVLGFGFDLRGGRTLDLTDLPRIQRMIEGELIGSGPDYLRTTYGLMVSGLVLSAFALLMALAAFNASMCDSDEEYTGSNSMNM